MGNFWKKLGTQRKFKSLNVYNKTWHLLAPKMSTWSRKKIVSVIRKRTATTWCTWSHQKKLSWLIFFVCLWRTDRRKVSFPSPISENFVPRRRRTTTRCILRPLCFAAGKNPAKIWIVKRFGFFWVGWEGWGVGLWLVYEDLMQTKIVPGEVKIGGSLEIFA